MRDLSFSNYSLSTAEGTTIEAIFACWKMRLKLSLTGRAESAKWLIGLRSSQVMGRLVVSWLNF